MFAHIVINQLREECAMTARLPWLSMIVTILAMMYIGFATAFWPQPEDDVDFEECDDDCQQDAYVEGMVEWRQQQEADLLEEARGLMQDSAGELHIAIPATDRVSRNCYGPKDKNEFTEGSDAWEALNAGRNIELHHSFIAMIWNQKGWLYTIFGDRKHGDSLSDHDHIPTWHTSYSPSFSCP